MEKLSEYISFDLEFNTVAEISHIIQVSAVKFRDGVEVDNFDTYVYTDVPLQSFINGLTGITSEKIANAPKLDKVLADFKDFVGETALVGYNALKSDLPLLAENDLPDPGVPSINPLGFFSFFLSAIIILLDTWFKP